MYEDLPEDGGNLTVDTCLPFWYLSASVGVNDPNQPQAEIRAELAEQFWPIPRLTNLRNFAIQREIEEDERKCLRYL